MIVCLRFIGIHAGAPKAEGVCDWTAGNCDVKRAGLWSAPPCYQANRRTKDKLYIRQTVKKIIGPFEAIYTVDKDLFLIVVCKASGYTTLVFGVFPKGVGGFRELRAACRNHFHLSWYL